MYKMLAILSILFASLNVDAQSADVKAALSAKNSGDFKTAISILEELADQGDSKAMTTIGLMYLDEKHEVHNYDLAYEWFLKAANAGDWDGVNNIGVMFRDGLGVKENKHVAYDLFMLVHLVGNSGNAISRANNNIRKLQESIPESEITEALKLPVRYVIEYMKLKGKVSEKTQKLKHKNDEKNFTDLYKQVYG